MSYFVYAVHNEITGKQYVGFTSHTPEKRWKEHLWDAASGKNGSPKLHKSIRKHGPLVWRLETVATFDSADDALQFEIATIAARDAIARGYNSSIGGTAPTMGMVMPKSFGCAITARQSGPGNHMFGRIPTDDERAAQSERMRLWHASNSHPRLGAKASDETRAKMSAAHSGKANSFYGRKHTEASLAAMSRNNPCKGMWGWMNPCTRANPAAMAIYARADRYFEWWIVATKRRGATAMANAFSEQRSKPHETIVAKFAKGWVPSNDERWVNAFK